MVNSSSELLLWGSQNNMTCEKYYGRAFFFLNKISGVKYLVLMEKKWRHQLWTLFCGTLCIWGAVKAKRLLDHFTKRALKIACSISYCSCLYCCCMQKSGKRDKTCYLPIQIVLVFILITGFFSAWKRSRHCIRQEAPWSNENLFSAK